MSESRKLLGLASIVADLAQLAKVHLEVAFPADEEAVRLTLRPLQGPRLSAGEGGDPGLRGEEEAPLRGQRVYVAPGPEVLNPNIVPSQWAPPPPPRPGEPGGGLVGSVRTAVRSRDQEADDEAVR